MFARPIWCAASGLHPPGGRARLSVAAERAALIAIFAKITRQNIDIIKYFLDFNLPTPTTTAIAHSTVVRAAIAPGAKPLLASIPGLYPWLRHVSADGGHAGQKLVAAMSNLGKWKVQIVKRPEKAKDFVVLPGRWVVVPHLDAFVAEQTVHLLDRVLAVTARRNTAAPSSICRRFAATAPP